MTELIETVLWFLLGLMLITVSSLLARMALSKTPRWVARGVLLGILATVAVFLLTPSRVLIDISIRVLEVGFNNGPLLLLTAALLIVPLASAVWMIRTSTDKGSWRST